MIKEVRSRSYRMILIFNDADWRDVSDELKRRFPNAVYFDQETTRVLDTARFEDSYYVRINEPDLAAEKKAKLVPADVQLLGNLWEGIDLFFSSKDYTQSGVSVEMRDPWPEDLASGDKVDLFGGWRSNVWPSDSAWEMRRSGKWVSFRYQRLIRPDTNPYYEGIKNDCFERMGVSPASVYPRIKLQIYQSASRVLSVWNKLDPEVKAFAGEVRRILLNQGTYSVALYDPMTNEIKDAKYTSSILIGWRALLDAALPESARIMAPIYSREGDAGLFGPRPDHPRLKRLMAGEPIQPGGRPADTVPSKTEKAPKRKRGRSPARRDA